LGALPFIALASVLLVAAIVVVVILAHI